ncbi:hypothetical protein [Novimethylophilus kurashikiensis]|uniref:hypothetical protein n=1 Tax=Novimethylophilus kurashikiensis TaxID=1825523 RepID=UPI0011B233DB|nr:hypothetical protein [Novimethylophilus kurashikiensis]
MNTHPKALVVFCSIIGISVFAGCSKQVPSKDLPNPPEVNPTPHEKVELGFIENGTKWPKILNVMYVAKNKNCDIKNKFEGVYTKQVLNEYLSLSSSQGSGVVSFYADKYLAGACQWELAGITLGPSPSTSVSIGSLLTSPLHDVPKKNYSYSCSISKQFWCYGADSINYSTNPGAFIIWRNK